MAIIKCKMCGGDLNLIEGASTAECEFCGSVQTVPKVDDEKKLTLFARANRLRAACEFDKAAGIYEAIVADFQEEAEAYWGLVLCKYGIEYVDDPATGKKIPTCHRSSFDSIMEDSDFEQVLENADSVARKVYREEAKTIEEIRKGIIAVSANERPYDIFICYKETAENGERTLDSVLAQDVYDALTDKGYRTFFARITLEDKLGMEYEPYIFAALNSAKIMLVFGTDYEYFNAVWVKNEWSRFLKLMSKDKEKHLIPCFKGIDAYDMPKEFARLQAQDMGKVGAIQDLLRGIEKLLPRQAETTTVIQERVVVGGSGNNKIASLLDRGNMALEDGDWAKADSFFEDVLNNDAKNAQAYLGKTLAMEKCRTIDAFVRKRKDAYQNVNEQTLKLQPQTAHIDQIVAKCSLTGYVDIQAIRQLYNFDLSYSSQVEGRKQQYREEELYWQNHKQLSRAEKFAVGAVAENLQREKKALFSALSDRVKKAETAETDAKTKVQQSYDVHIAQSDKKADQLYQDGLNRREKYYQSLLQIAKNETNVKKLQDAASKFDAFGGYQDSKNLAEHCRKRVAEEQAKLDAEAERKRIFREKQEKERRKKQKRIMILSVAAVVAMIVAILFVTQFLIPNSQYQRAEKMLANGQYEDAISVFAALGDFRNSKQMVLECKYIRAVTWIKDRRCDEAIIEFSNLGNYRDSEDMILECHYTQALMRMEEGKYGEAIRAFAELGDYKDSKAMIDRCNTAAMDESYQTAVALMEEGKYEEAVVIFESLKGYRDSWHMIKACKNGILDNQYEAAVALMKAEKYAEAITAFQALNGHKDSASKISQCKEAIREIQYQDAVALLKAEQYQKAALMLGSLGDYKDATQKSLEAWSFVAKRKTISAASDYIIAVKTNGTVVSDTSTDYELSDYGQCDVSDWTDIIAVSAGTTHTVGLKADGTVVATGLSGGCDVDGWKNIVDIATLGSTTIGLKSDGTVLVASSFMSEDFISDLQTWTDIVDIDNGANHVVGLKSDGTVVGATLYDNGYGEHNVSGWRDVVAINAGYLTTFGWKADGTIIAVGNNEYGQCEISGWKDVVSIVTEFSWTIGIKKNGTLVYTGSDASYFEYYLRTWEDIVAVAFGSNILFGLRNDGTIEVLEWYGGGFDNVANWTNIKIP